MCVCVRHRSLQVPTECTRADTAQMLDRWKTTGLWNEIDSVKEVFLESKGNQEAFDSLLSAYRCVKMCECVAAASSVRALAVSAGRVWSSTRAPSCRSGSP